MLFNFYQTAIFAYLSLLVVAVFSFRSVWDELDFSLSLILYPVRNSLPFTSLRSVTVSLGRDFLEGDTRRGQARGLLEPADPVPADAEVVVHEDGARVEEKLVRGVSVRWVST